MLRVCKISTGWYYDQSITSWCISDASQADHWMVRLREGVWWRLEIVMPKKWFPGARNFVNNFFVNNFCGLACQACGLLNAILPLQHWFLRFYVQLVVAEVKLKPKGTVRAFTIKQLWARETTMTDNLPIEEQATQADDAVEDKVCKRGLLQYSSVLFTNWHIVKETLFRNYFSSYAPFPFVADAIDAWRWQ